MTRILIIEDDEDIAFIEKDYLEVSGYQVTVEINGIKGLTEALTGEYDLILLDVMLPGMDGFQICRKLRNKLDIPIMMVTAKRTEIDQIRGLGFGADDYIEKPFSPGVLVAKVKSQLSQYERLKGKRKAGQRVTLGDISLESDTHRVFVRGEEKMLPKGIQAAGISHAPSGCGVQPGNSLYAHLGDGFTRQYGYGPCPYQSHP